MGNYNTPIKGESKIKDCGKKIFSLFKKRAKTWQFDEATTTDEGNSVEIFSLLDSDMQNVKQAIKQIVAQEMTCDTEIIYPETTLREELGMSEENIANIMREIQDIIKIPTEKRAIETQITTIFHIIKYVETHR